MQFLADESCDFNFVRALRAAGHEVLAVAEIALSAEDPEVIRNTGLSLREGVMAVLNNADNKQMLTKSLSWSSSVTGSIG